MPVYVPGPNEPKSLGRMRKHAQGHQFDNPGFTYNSSISTGQEASLTTISISLGNNMVATSDNAPFFVSSTPHKMSEFSSMKSYEHMQQQNTGGGKV